jgi:hypothetical protein
MRDRRAVDVEILFLSVAHWSIPSVRRAVNPTGQRTVRQTGHRVCIGYASTGRTPNPHAETRPLPDRIRTGRDATLRCPLNGYRANRRAAQNKIV